MVEKNTYLSSASIKEQGRTAYYKMLESARQGELIQVRRGVYANIDQLSGNMIDIETVVPDGILCLWSAWNIHQLTTSMPQAFHVAIFLLLFLNFQMNLQYIRKTFVYLHRKFKGYGYDDNGNNSSSSVGQQVLKGTECKGIRKEKGEETTYTRAAEGIQQDGSRVH